MITADIVLVMTKKSFSFTLSNNGDESKSTVNDDTVSDDTQRLSALKSGDLDKLDEV